MPSPALCFTVLPMTEGYWQRFGGLARMIGRPAQERLAAAHVAIIGVGGVGSWVVEALARSGIGQLTLVDMDDVCITNFNRQLPAVEGNVGKPKIEALAERVRLINPECVVHQRYEFYTDSSEDRILAEPYSYVVDAIDRLSNKCALLAACRERWQPVITLGSAGERLDPTLVQVQDLTKVVYDDLLKMVRKKLRAEYGFPRETRRHFKIPAVFSPEPQHGNPLVVPLKPVTDGTCENPLDPASRSGKGCDRGLGSAVFVTSVFGMVAAAEVVKRLLTPEQVHQTGGQSLPQPSSPEFQD
ncbi:MAG: tRNA threonylcarbamoyladenosine dehydratase [Verrucomicrobiota bacterium]|nr:tRNA threonylcarbamoyladenosine dehydratase [Verrucomicrobiota bacterium]